MLARVALWTSALAMVVSLLFGALDTFGIGLSSPAPATDDISQRIMDRFLAAEEAYWLWGRWIDLSSAIGFGALVIAAPILSARAVVLVAFAAGGTLAVAGEAIDLSKLAGLEIARVGLDGGLADVFAAGNVFRFAINTTSTFVWISGLFVLSIGFFLVGREAVEPRLRLLSVTVAASLVIRGISGPFGDLPLPGIVFIAATTVFVVAFVAWVATTLRNTARHEADTSKRTMGSPPG